ncbi:MAG: hypothetical protein ABEJ72_04065 [Candidatus Aenigmatarchaeota archaeon]
MKNKQLPDTFEGLKDESFFRNYPDIERELFKGQEDGLFNIEFIRGHEMNGTDILNVGCFHGEESYENDLRFFENVIERSDGVLTERHGDGFPFFDLIDGIAHEKDSDVYKTDPLIVNTTGVELVRTSGIYPLGVGLGESLEAVSEITTSHPVNIPEAGAGIAALGAGYWLFKGSRMGRFTRNISNAIRGKAKASYYESEFMRKYGLTTLDFRDYAAASAVKEITEDEDMDSLSIFYGVGHTEGIDGYLEEDPEPGWKQTLYSKVNQLRFGDRENNYYRKFTRT